LVKSEVDEKNLDGEILKIKDKLSAKIAERTKSKPKSRPAHDGIDEDEMDGVEQDTRGPRGKRAAPDPLWDDDLMDDGPATKKRRTAAPKTSTRGGAAGRGRGSRASSVASDGPPARKTPARKAATQRKKVRLW
jgi:hypothetical protein